MLLTDFTDLTKPQLLLIPKAIVSLAKLETLLQSSHLRQNYEDCGNFFFFFVSAKITELQVRKIKTSGGHICALFIAFFSRT